MGPSDLGVDSSVHTRTMRWCQDGAWDTGNAQMRAWFTPPGESVPTEWYPWPLSSVLKGAVDFERELLGVNRGAQGRANRESRYKKSNDSRQEVTVFGCSTHYVEGIRERNI